MRKSQTGTYDDQLVAIHAAYVSSSGRHMVTTREVMAWAIETDDARFWTQEQGPQEKGRRKGAMHLSEGIQEGCVTLELLGNWVGW